MGSFEKILFILTGNKCRATQQKTNKHTNKQIDCWLKIRPSGNLARWVSGPIGKWRIGHPTGWIPNNTSKTKADRKLSVQEYNKKWLNAAEAPISLPRITSHLASYSKQVKHDGRKNWPRKLVEDEEIIHLPCPHQSDTKSIQKYEANTRSPTTSPIQESHGSPTQKKCVV